MVYCNNNNCVNVTVKEKKKKHKIQNKRSREMLLSEKETFIPTHNASIKSCKPNSLVVPNKTVFNR